MDTIIRRIRGLAGLALFAGIAWAAIGAVIWIGVRIIDPASIDPGEGIFWLIYHFGRAGLVAGAVAGLVLAFAERRKSSATIRLPRLTVWGALGGFAIPWLAAGPRAMLPFFVVLGAGTGAVTWALARRGEKLALGEGSDAPPQLHKGSG